MVLIAWSFFNIGRITGGQEHQIRISAAHNKEARDATPERSVPLDTRVVASKNSSSMKYHYSWCGSGRRIKPENQVWFTSAALAEAAGYTLAGNCQ